MARYLRVLQVVGGIVPLFVLFACCLTPRLLDLTSTKKHKTSEIYGAVDILIFNPNGPYISVQSVRGLSRVHSYIYIYLECDV